jgi:putative DNA primase/helicase
MNSYQDDLFSNELSRDVHTIGEGKCCSAPKASPNVALTYCTPDLLTDQRLKYYFTYLYKDIVRYVPGIGWHFWNGQRWFTNLAGGLHPLIDKMQRALMEKAANISDEKARLDRKKALIGLECHPRQLTLISACEHVPELITEADKLDRDVMLLNTLNGTVDLRTGMLQPHEPSNLITRMVSIEYDVSVQCPVFMKFLNWAMCGDTELVSYLQRFFGYCLTGMTSEQILNFWYGTGGNGKTTLMNVIVRLLGDYATTADTGLIMKRNNSSDGNRLAMLASLRGSRLVTLSEVNEGEKLDEAAIKSFTGGDTITCRYLYGGFFSYTPQAKLIGFGNYKPNIGGTDYGIWRRIHLILFKAVITEEEKDILLSEKLRGELSGILAWAVKGCIEWQQIGLNPPSAIINATQEYRQTEDIFSNWLNEGCTVSPNQSESAAALLQSFKEFSGWRATTPAKFGRMLSGKGFTKRKSNGNIVWDGLSLESRDIRDD